MRTENDSMGEVQIPDNVLWGAQTQRAIENFPISGQRFGVPFIHNFARVKRACAQSNIHLGLLDAAVGKVIIQACYEVISGDHNDQFPLDVFQTGSGTSTNMNFNEVIANRANQLLGGKVGSRSPVHPNDHVNMSQSSNDVVPTVIHITGSLLMRDKLIPALKALENALQVKAVAFDQIVKPGRTHLQDATPIRLGQVFSGYAMQLTKAIVRIQHARNALQELPLGGTAVGTGLNCPSGFPKLVLSHINQDLETDFIEALNHIEANATRDGIVEASGQLRTVAVSLAKIANDIRWLASGPRNGLGELRLPAVQPGSSIMPGKVNPVIIEALLMTTAQVIGNDAAILQGGLGSIFELNMMMPLMAHRLMNSIEWLANAVQIFSDRCVMGLQADEDRCNQLVSRNLAIVTSLAPVIGYDKAAELSKEAARSDRTIREVALEWDLFPPEKLDYLLNPFKLTG